MESFKNKRVTKTSENPKDLQCGHRAMYLSTLMVTYKKKCKNVRLKDLTLTASFIYAMSVQLILHKSSLQKWSLNKIQKHEKNLLRFWGKTEEEEKHGIVIPYVYVSGHDYSVQAMHIEDEGFFSVNILHDGDDVLWMVIPDCAQEDLVIALVEYWWGPIKEIEKNYLCLLKTYIIEKLSHKQLFIKEEFLLESHIPYHPFRQQKGDMIVGKR